MRPPQRGRGTQIAAPRRPNQRANSQVDALKFTYYFRARHRTRNGEAVGGPVRAPNVTPVLSAQTAYSLTPKSEK
jgi:hypothetical protein